MNSQDRALSNFLHEEFLVKKRFLFFLLSFLLVPSFIGILPTDTQPWYMPSFLIIAFCFIKSKAQFQYFFGMIFLLCAYLFIRQFSYGGIETISKSITYTFFLFMLPLFSREFIALIDDYAFKIIVFHIIFSFVLKFISQGFFELIYSSRDLDTLGFRSLAFAFPEPSYAAKVLCFTALSLHLYRNSDKKKYELLILALLAILTLSLTGILLGMLTLLALIDNKQRLTLLFFMALFLYLVIFDYIALPGRLYIVQEAARNFDLQLLLLDESFVTRVTTFQNILYYFSNFNLYGFPLQPAAVSFLSLIFFGFIGLCFILFSFLNFFFLALRGKVFIFLVFVLSSFSDTFVYPAFALFIMAAFYSNFAFIKNFHHAK